MWTRNSPGARGTLAAANIADEHVAIIAFSDKVIEAARRRLPKVAAYWLVALKRDPAQANRPSPDPTQIEQTLRRIGALGVDIGVEDRLFEAEAAASIRQAGFEIHCWTVDTEQLARYCRQLEAKSITTNRPAELRAELSRSP